MSFVSIDQTAMPDSKELYFAGATYDFHTNSSELVTALEPCDGSNRKLIRDIAGVVDGSEISIVSDGTLRVLHLRGTILIHDREGLEFLGFNSRNVSLLIPALLNPITKGKLIRPFLQRSDKRHIA
jgi:hypothetical protein